MNVFGMIRMCQLVLPAIRRQNEGRIINLSSIAGEIEQPGTAIYATKHAIEAIDAALRVEVEDFGVRVMGVQPGPVNTNFDEVAAASIPDTGPGSPYVTFKQNIANTPTTLPVRRRRRARTRGRRKGHSRCRDR